MADAAAYSPKFARPGDAVPLARQAIASGIAAAHWHPPFNTLARTNEAKAYDNFDLDAALAAGAETLKLVAEIAELRGSDEAVMTWLTAARDKLAAERNPEPAADLST